MKNQGEIRWLQLSDLHMFVSTEVAYQKKALLNLFKDRVDFVVITGDLHQYGEDYSLTIQFLKGLITSWNMEFEDIVIVPGNHDIQDTSKRKIALNIIDKELENNPDAYRSELDNLYTGFTKYKRFCNELYGNDSNQNLLENNIYIWKDNIALLCINTALISDENHDKKQIVDIYRLAELENRGYPCIAVMHHDFYAISDRHLPYIEACFRDLGVSAVLSGHKHKYSRSVIDLKNGQLIPNYCCAKSCSQPGDLWSDIGIIEYRWNLKKEEVKVIPYEWDTDNLSFQPSTKFEDVGSVEVNDDGNIKLNKSFALKKSFVDSKSENKKNEGEGHVLNKFESFYDNIQKDYLDGILEYIDDNNKKFNQAIDIIERIIFCNGKRINFNQIINNIITCKQKIVLSISGLQGTGKSTFLSLVFYELRRKFEETNIFPILLDLHVLDKYSKRKAKERLKEHLKEIDILINKYSKIRFILLVDGADDYIRKTSDLEEILLRYVEQNKVDNFAFCIGSADNFPNEMCKVSKLKGISNKATYKVDAYSLKKDDDENITFILKNLIDIYSFKIEQNQINIIKKAINVYTINRIDYRTLLIVLRVFSINSKNGVVTQLGSYFYEYYLMMMGSNEKELYKHAKAVYQYIILKQPEALRGNNLKYTKIIYNNGITIDFLLAYYFVYLIKSNNDELENVLNSDFVFTASVNKFIKDLLLNKYNGEQEQIVDRLIKSYEVSDMSMKSQICYILGRIEESNAKEKAKHFLREKWDQLYKDLFDDNILILKEYDIKNELVLFRTISVSLIWIGYDKNQERFLRCLLLNEKLNQINRGFHLEYYEDKAYMNGVKPTYVDNKNISVDKTMKYLINNINRGFSKTGEFNKSIYLDIITLFSIYQYRMGNDEIKRKYSEILLKIAEKVLQSSKIQSRTITNYVTTVRELLMENPYNQFMTEIYQVKNVKREGWIRRNVQLPESIAEHMYGCYLLGTFFLPNNVAQCIDYNIPDIESYLDYSKESILKMLLIHDLAEAKIGDIVTQEKVKKDTEDEDKRFEYYEFLCSFPHIYGLGNRKKAWDEFIENATINAKIANDFDKIEPVIQAYFYLKGGNTIDLDEWKEYALKNVKTSLGKQILMFVMEKILV